MWFLGLVAGAAIGGLLGGEGWALVGGILGTLAGVRYGAVFRAQPHAAEAEGALKNAELQSKVDHLYRCLEDVNNRLAALERTAGAPEKYAAPVAENAAAMPAAVATPTAAAVAYPLEPQLPATAAASDSATISSAPIAAEAGTREESIAPAPIPQERVDPPATQTRKDEANFVTRWLFGGNTLVRVGVILLFFGVAFLLKYAAERDLVPIELRLAAVAAGAIALLIVGWRLRESRAGYALVLQGGGVGVLYLTVFAALRLYHLVPPELAFAVLAAIAAFSAALAVLQDSRALAITGAAGGFLAPVLASTGGGSHVALFSFYAVLDAGILAIAYYKAWRELNLVGFAFTFVIGLAWGERNYSPELFSSTEPFLILFFLFYVAIAVLFSLRQAPRLAHYVDGTLVFGTPLVAFGLQAALVRDMEFGAAWSALALGAFYIALATVLYARKQQTLVLLVESFLALGVGFATLAVPLAFDGRLTSAVWAVEGAAIVWTGVRQQRRLARAFGLFLQFAAGIAFLAGDGPRGETPVFNSVYLGAVMVSAAGLFCSFYLQRHRERMSKGELAVAPVLFVWGLLWWFIAGLVEIDRCVGPVWELHAEHLFFVATCAIFALLWRRLDWNAARFVALASVPLSTLIVLWMIAAPGAQPHPFAAHAWFGWLMAFAVHLRVLRLHEGRAGPWLERLHAAGFWLLAVVLSWEVGWQIDHYVEGHRVWPLIAWAIVPGALIAVFAARGERLGWPVSTHRYAYLYAGALPLAIFLLGWIVYVNFASNGDPAPLPYVPLLNPLDLAQVGAVLALVTWYIGVKRLNLPLAQLPGQEVVAKVLAAVLFIALNGVLLRTLHHYAGVPFQLDAMLRSVLVQMALSLFWTGLAVAAMFTAARRSERAWWVAGATLLGIVVAKLFLIDLSSSGTVERWISFIGVGILIIVIGYFAPVPPKATEKPA